MASDAPLKIFTAGLGVESNTFSGLDVDWSDFAQICLYRDGTHPEELSEISAPLFVLRERARRLGWQVVEGPYAFALPAGRVKKQVYEDLRDEIVASAVAHAPYDFIALSLHGAMTAYDYDDCEGDLLRHLREALGAAVPIGAELDPHAHLSQEMFDNADILIAFKEYPHTDFLPRAEELVAALERCVRTGAKPAKAMVDCRTIGRFHTFREPMRSLVRAMEAAEEQNGVWSLSYVHGFPWGDVADMGAKCIAYADHEAAAAAAAEDFALRLIGIRADSFSPPLSLDEALAQALAGPGRTTLAEVSDNPGGGAAGNSTALLERLIASGVSACIGPFWDPAAVERAFEAGEGAVLDLDLGAPPLRVRASVSSLRAAHSQTWAGTSAPLGRACALSIGAVDVAVCSLRDQAYSPDLFTGLGLNLDRYRIFAVKSAQHFVAGFTPVSDRIVLAAGGGPLETDFRKIAYRKVRRPIWPLDGDDEQN